MFSLLTITVRYQVLLFTKVVTRHVLLRMKDAQECRTRRRGVRAAADYTSATAVSRSNVCDIVFPSTQNNVEASNDNMEPINRRKKNTLVDIPHEGS